MWQLDNEHSSCCCIEPQSPVNVCEEIDNNSATRKPTFIKIHSKLLNVNMSKGRISPLDSLHLCQTSEQLGWWLWLEVERKDPSGPSRMVHTVCHNLGWLRFSVLAAQNFTQEYIIAPGWFFVFSFVVLCFHIVQDSKSLINWCNPCVSTRPATSCDHCFFYYKIMDASGLRRACVSKEKWGPLAVLSQNFPLTI
jgi:hypothetical protein